MKKRAADHFGVRADKGWKATLFSSPRLMLGVNCLEPGQTQSLHAHAGQDKAYIVLEGSGRFTVGTDTCDASVGDVVWAPADSTHGMTNTGTVRLSVITAIAPAPAGA